MFPKIIFNFEEIVSSCNFASASEFVSVKLRIFFLGGLKMGKYNQTLDNSFRKGST